MPDETIDRLDRRYRQLERQQTDVDFLRQLRPYLEALDDERAARLALKGLGREAEAAVDDFTGLQRALVEMAVDIRDRLIAAAPEVDNSQVERPEGQVSGAWDLDSLLQFDRLAQVRGRLEFPLLAHYAINDKTPLGTMLVILRGRLRMAQYRDQQGLLGDQTNYRPDLDDIWRELNNLAERHEVAFERFKDQAQTLPGLANERLRALEAKLRREPLIIEENHDPDQLHELLFVRGAEQMMLPGIMRAAVQGEHLDSGDEEVLRRGVAFLRAQAELLHEEVVDRIRRDRRSLRARAGRSLGLGSRKVVAVYVSAIIGLIALATIARAQNWIWGDNKNDGRVEQPSSGTE